MHQDCSQWYYPFAARDGAAKKRLRWIRVSHLGKFSWDLNNILKQGGFKLAWNWNWKETRTGTQQKLNLLIVSSVLVLLILAIYLVFCSIELREYLYYLPI